MVQLGPSSSWVAPDLLNISVLCCPRTNATSVQYDRSLQYTCEVAGKTDVNMPAYLVDKETKTQPVKCVAWLCWDIVLMVPRFSQYKSWVILLH